MKIKIPAQTKLNVSENVLRDVKENTRSEQNKFTNGKNKFIAVAEHHTGEKKFYQMLGIDYEGRKYVSVLPSPTHLFITTAIELFEISEKRKSIDFKECGKKDKNSNLYLLDFNAGYTHECYTDYLKARIASIIMLISSLENFMNQKIPDNFIYEKFEKGKLKKYNHKKIEASISFKEKLEQILPIAINNLTFWGNKKRELEIIFKLYDQRKTFIHLKTNSEKEWKMYSESFDKMISFDLSEAINTIINTVNSIEKDFFEIETN